MNLNFRVFILIQVIKMHCPMKILARMSDPEHNVTISKMSLTRKQILAAQYECFLKLLHDPPHLDSDAYCNRTWDGWMCWADTTAGTATQYCPSYFQDFDPHEKVTKVCNPDGQWFRHPESNRIWSNYTLCSAFTGYKLKVALIQYYLAIVGQSLSLLFLLISFCIFSGIKSLSCQRITLHKNMFLSFIFNSIITIIWLSGVVEKHYIASSHVGCKILSILIFYSVSTNFFWMLCEGIYLHTLIIVAVFVGEQQLGWYYILGWAFPVIPVMTYTVARWLFYNNGCWLQADSNFIYIIHGPLHVALVVNLFFLLNILRVLITKLKVTHSAESNTYMMAVRATLILVPLLGAQFIVMPSQPNERTAKAVYEFIMNIFMHFQGFLVALLFCFCNTEVQGALKRQWWLYKAQWRGQYLTTDSHSFHIGASITETSRATISLNCLDVEDKIALKHQNNGDSKGICSYNTDHNSPKILETTEV
ncbi:calcitonin gene-related peptide type 1 receptor-like [Sardina pilchardus]|uniref:calcitonin gene-related peptide type 1 receptor-like n=1 Tax=Sardina pilchardus TaxID=27697 RepID=UPI002E0EDDB8